MFDERFSRVSLVGACVPAQPFSPLFARKPVVPDVDAAVETPVAADPYAEGLADGRRAAECNFAEARNRFALLLASANALQPEPSEELAAMIATTVERLVTEIVGAFTIDSAWLNARIARAITCLDEADAARTLWLHPDDAALLEGIVLPLEIASDPQMERGALRIACSHGWIEDSRSLHLDALRALLGTGAKP